MWDTVGYTVGNVWPHLRGWIMRHIPSDDDEEWFTGEDRIGEGDEGYINDPHIATKHSSLERVGFFSTCLLFNTNFCYSLYFEYSVVESLRYRLRADPSPCYTRG